MRARSSASRSVPGAATPEAERETLDAWARRQDELPWLRFGTPGNDGADQASHIEAVADADPVDSTQLGLKNLDRVMKLLVPAAVRPDADFADLGELYQERVSQWARELQHVTILVGGVESQERHGSHAGVRFRPLPANRQREAVALLNDHAFAEVGFLLDVDVLRRIEARGASSGSRRTSSGFSRDCSTTDVPTG